MLKKFINQKYLNDLECRRKEFKDNIPFSHIVLKDFFSEELIKKFKLELIKEDFPTFGYPKIPTESGLFLLKDNNVLRSS